MVDSDSGKPELSKTYATGNGEDYYDGYALECGEEDDSSPCDEQSLQAEGIAYYNTLVLQSVLFVICTTTDGSDHTLHARQHL